MKNEKYVSPIVEAIEIEIENTILNNSITSAQVEDYTSGVSWGDNSEF